MDFNLCVSEEDRERDGAGHTGAGMRGKTEDGERK